MLAAQRAPVRPRVSPPGGGDSLPLEEEIAALLESGARGVSYLFGPPGAGKTTALQHLRAVLPADAPVVLVDEPGAAAVPPDPAAGRLVVCATSHVPPGSGPVYRLAPWGEDEFIEYLLAAHRQQCASVLKRLRGDRNAHACANPQLGRVILDELAGDESLPGAYAALRHFVVRLLAGNDPLRRGGEACLKALAGKIEDKMFVIHALVEAGFKRDAILYLRHPEVQLLVAAEHAATELRLRKPCDFLAQRLPRDVVGAIAVAVVGDEPVERHLRTYLRDAPDKQAMAASLLHRVTPGWVPEPGAALNLTGAYLEGAAWAGALLRGMTLQNADLHGADLRDGNLDKAALIGANLRRARLARASLERTRLAEADLTGADLTAARGAHTSWNAAALEDACLDSASLVNASFAGASLRGARFASADLTGATITAAILEGADFSAANLRRARLAGQRLREADFRGACFAEADLRACDLEGVDLPGLEAPQARLDRALLTAATLCNANLRGASLREAGLGDVNLQGACLCEADLRGATFHMGSTRSGLLITPIASEGTRTGFYTDDADEQNFKAPEEIRKANLCGADLRGARIDDVDFYLVDLRGALYDPEQEQHFRHCRAILEDRAC